MVSAEGAAAGPAESEPGLQPVSVAVNPEKMNALDAVNRRVMGAISDILAKGGFSKHMKVIDERMIVRSINVA